MFYRISTILFIQFHNFFLNPVSNIFCVIKFQILFSFIKFKHLNFNPVLNQFFNIITKKIYLIQFKQIFHPVKMNDLCDFQLFINIILD